MAGSDPKRLSAPPAAAARPATPVRKPLVKAKAKAKPAPRTPSQPRERMTLDGPWEWAFDRMLERKRAAEAQAQQAARQAAKLQAAASQAAASQAAKSSAEPASKPAAKRAPAKRKAPVDGA